MTNARRTKVSKSHPAIKAIIAATFPTWTGRKVTVIEASEGWGHTQCIDDQTSVMHLDLATGAVGRAERPTYGGPSVVHRAHFGIAVVMLSRFMGQDMGVEIIVDATQGLDDAELAVGLDAVEMGAKPADYAARLCGARATGIIAALLAAGTKARSSGKAAA